jgi:hypothetical protein
MIEEGQALTSKKHNGEATMQSTAKTVTAYLDEVPADRKAALAKLRDLCRRLLKGYEESMQ